MNLYFQDEARFGLMTHLGKCLTAKGVKPLVSYQQAFKSTYLYGSFSPINEDSFVFEIEGTSSYIFYQYLKQFSEYKPYEFKIILIDNAGFHSLKHFEIPKNIALIRIPPYSPELNPAEKIWAYIKQRYKNNTFINLQRVKYWLHDFINKELHSELVKSITNDKLYLNAFNDCNI